MVYTHGSLTRNFSTSSGVKNLKILGMYHKTFLDRNAWTKNMTSLHKNWCQYPQFKIYQPLVAPNIPVDQNIPTNKNGLYTAFVLQNMELTRKYFGFLTTKSKLIVKCIKFYTRGILNRKKNSTQKKIL